MGEYAAWARGPRAAGAPRAPRAAPAGTASALHVVQELAAVGEIHAPGDVLPAGVVAHGQAGDEHPVVVVALGQLAGHLDYGVHLPARWPHSAEGAGTPAAAKSPGCRRGAQGDPAGDAVGLARHVVLELHLRLDLLDVGRGVAAEVGVKRLQDTAAAHHRRGLRAVQVHEHVGRRSAGGEDLRPSRSARRRCRPCRRSSPASRASAMNCCANCWSSSTVPRVMPQSDAGLGAWRPGWPAAGAHAAPAAATAAPPALSTAPRARNARLLTAAAMPAMPVSFLDWARPGRCALR